MSQPQAPPPSHDEEPDWTGWPSPPPGYAEGPTKIFEAQLAARLKRVEEATALAQASYVSFLSQDVEFHKALLEVAKGGLDRARANAETVQKAAGGIGALYTGVLGVAFSVTSHPLPPRGAIPALFLGLAVALATAYLAYLSRRDDPPGAQRNLRQPNSVPEQFARLSLLVEWVRQAVRRRVGFLRAAVLALALGVITLPLPFVTVPGITAVNAEAISLPAWPKPETAPENAELGRIRYQAEIAEAARDRQSVLANGMNENDLLSSVVVLVVGLIVILIGGLRSRE